MGRNKKKGDRYPGGKLKPTGDPIAPAAWARIRTDSAKAAGDPRLSSQIGRLSFHRELTDVQVTAALRVGAIYGAWERQNGLTRRTHSPSYESGFGGGRSRDEDEAQIAAVSKAYASLDEELKLYPPTWRNTLESLCCNDEFVPSALLPGVRGMLDVLASFFGISKSRRREQVRHAPPPVRHAPAVVIVVAKSASTEKIAYLLMLKAMRPDLDAEGRETAWEFYMAMKDREQFNRSKRK